MQYQKKIIILWLSKVKLKCINFNEKSVFRTLETCVKKLIFIEERLKFSPTCFPYIQIYMHIYTSHTHCSQGENNYKKNKLLQYMMINKNSSVTLKSIFL